jgi:DNA repair protein RecN (Recombination protein N)
MLQKLYIRNYAIIDELTLTFDEQLNVLTGETGAGKSIIVGALSLMLGERADTTVLIKREEKCIVEAAFLTRDNKPFNTILSEAELDIEPITLIRREISAGGKSRAFINDTPVNLATLNKVTEFLVDLHRQFDHYALKEDQFMYAVIDAVSGNAGLAQQYRKKYQDFKKHQAAYQLALNQQLEWQKETDYKQFLFDELQDADWQEGEMEEAEINLKQLSHSEQIKQVLQMVSYILEEGETAVNTELRRLLQQLQNISDVHPDGTILAGRLESVLLELRDIAEESSNLERHVDLNPGQIQVLQERLDLGYRLWKKHQIQSTRELIEIKERLESELRQHHDIETRTGAMEKELTALRIDMERDADALHQKRKLQAPLFAEEVNRSLSLIGMPNAILKIEVDKTEHCDERGRDHISFLWDANKSGKFLAVQKSASGGELSRIMLCIKALTAKAMDLPTLIFDEVDTGISGEAARQVGVLLRSLSERHQVICITHQPQIAGKGSRHFYVYKALEHNQIQTRIRVLTREERVHNIAQMIGGEHPSDAALKSARELVD